jgi:hypothetical protein
MVGTQTNSGITRCTARTSAGGFSSDGLMAQRCIGSLAMRGTEMLFGIRIHRRIDVPEAEPVSQQFDIILLAGQEHPARTDAMLLGIGRHDLRRVVLWLQRDRDEEDILADPIAQHFLHADEVFRRQRADIVARGEEEVDEEDLALHHVIVEPQRAAVLSHHRNVGEPFHTVLGQFFRLARDR